jgi:hypothetical protein
MQDIRALIVAVVAEVAAAQRRHQQSGERPWVRRAAAAIRWGQLWGQLRQNIGL